MGIDQLVNAYKGNPAPLQAKVQQAQKNQPPGAIPPDLEEAIALQKITELRNSAQAQQAMQAGGAQPSVVEKMRQMLGAEQRQQAQPPQMPQAPQGIPPQGQPQMAQPPQQPPQPPQGVNALPSNVGQQYAHGGIIGNVRHFFAGDEVTDSEVKKAKQREEDRRSLLGFPAALGDVAQLPVAAGYNLVADTGSGLEKLLNRIGSALTGENINTQNENQVGNKFRFSPTPFTDMLRSKPEEEKGPLERGRLKDPRSGANRFPSAQEQLDESEAFSSAQNKPRVNAAASGQAGDAGGGNSSIINDLVKQGIIQKPGNDAAYKKLANIMGMDADTEETKAINKFKQQVGDKDLSIYDEMSKELKARKERLNAPAKGFDSVMEYLGQIAQGGGGRSWMEAGAKGAANLTAFQKERQAQQDSLVDKILDLGAKKKEAEYGQKEKMYDIGQARYKDVFKNTFDAAKDVNKSDDEARRLAADAVMKQKELDNRLQTARIGQHDNLMSRAQALMAADPTKKMTLEEAMKRAAMAAGATQLESTDARRSKSYIDAKEKIDTRFQHLINDTPYGKKQKALYDKAITDLNESMGVSGGGINTLPGAGSSGTVPAVGTVMEGYRFKGGNPRDQNNWEKV